MQKMDDNRNGQTGQTEEENGIEKTECHKKLTTKAQSLLRKNPFSVFFSFVSFVPLW